MRTIVTPLLMAQGHGGHGGRSIRLSRQVRPARRPEGAMPMTRTEAPPHAGGRAIVGGMAAAAEPGLRGERGRAVWARSPRDASSRSVPKACAPVLGSVGPAIGAQTRWEIAKSIHAQRSACRPEATL